MSVYDQVKIRDCWKLNIQIFQLYFLARVPKHKDPEEGFRSEEGLEKTSLNPAFNDYSQHEPSSQHIYIWSNLNKKRR